MNSSVTLTDALLIQKKNEIKNITTQTEARAERVVLFRDFRLFDRIRRTNLLPRRSFPTFIEVSFHSICLADYKVPVLPLPSGSPNLCPIDALLFGINKRILISF